MDNTTALRLFLSGAALIAAGTAQAFAFGHPCPPLCLSNQLSTPLGSSTSNTANFLVQNTQTEQSQVPSNSVDPSVEHNEPTSNPNAPFDLHVERREVGVQTEGGRFNLSEQQERQLARFRLEIVIDRSLSMGERDCPGNQTRWHWCGMQAEDLAKLIAPYSKDGVTITSFAWRYDVVENATPDTIQRLFSHDSLGPGTRLAGPLKNRLENFFAHQGEDKRPMLLAVITDGVPVPPPQPLMVRHVLMQAAKRIDTPGQVIVVFFQIGKIDLFGKLFLHQLEKDIRRRDKEHPLVQYVSFKELERIGLAKALVQVIGKYLPCRAKSC